VVDRNLAAIAGIRKNGIIPISFIVVKSKFQGRGLGKILMSRLHKLAKDKYSFLILSVMKENNQAIRLFKKCGYQKLHKNKEIYFLIYPINIIGKLISKFSLLR
jgi:ribosomal protein S18 acetylase RimI-like enzyme